MLLLGGGQGEPPTRRRYCPPYRSHYEENWTKTIVLIVMGGTGGDGNHSQRLECYMPILLLLLLLFLLFCDSVYILYFLSYTHFLFRVRWSCFEWLAVFY